MEGKGRDTQTCNIVWNMERDQSFWISSSEHQGMMPKYIRHNIFYERKENENCCL